MRSMMVGLGLAAMVASAFAYPAIAAKTSLGCEKGKEVWNAAAGKCEPGTYKKPAKSAKKPEKK